MSNVLFNRELRVEIFSESGTVRLIEGLHISFTATLRSRGNPNEATISVYNLAPDTRNALRVDGVGVRLFGGYNGKSDKIFEGTIITPVTNPDDAVNMVTEIYSGDGYRNLNRSFFSKSYASGTLLKVILRDVAGTLGLPFDIDSRVVDGISILRGRSFDSKTKRALNDLSRDFNFNWRINFGVLNIGVVDEADRTSPTAIALNANTGLIGTPTVKFERYKGDTRRRVVAPSLLNAGLRPGRLVEIESKKAVIEYDKKFKNNRSEISTDGVYLIDEVTHSGDNFGGDFDSEVTGYGNK